MSIRIMPSPWLRIGLVLIALLSFQDARSDSGRSDPDSRRARSQKKERQAEIQGWTDKDWEAYGQSLTKDPEYQKMPPKDRAAYIADRVGAKLDEGGIVPNVSVFGRARSGLEHGKLDSGTCSDLTEKLGSAFTGAGIDNGKVVVNQTGLKSWNPLNVNSDHGAPFVVIDGKKYVMDMWLHGGDQRGWISDGKFSGFKGSGFDGMALEDWKSIMEESGYDLSTVEEYYVDPKAEEARQVARQLVEDTVKSLGVDPEGKSMGQLNEIIRNKAGELGLDPEGNKKVSELVEAIRDNREEGGEGAKPPGVDAVPDPAEGATAGGGGQAPAEEDAGVDGEAGGMDAQDAKTADGETPSSPDEAMPPPDETDQTAGRGREKAPGRSDGEGRSTGEAEPEGEDEGRMAGGEPDSADETSTGSDMMAGGASATGGDEGPRNDAGAKVDAGAYQEGDRVITADGTEYANRGGEWVKTGETHVPYTPEDSGTKTGSKTDGLRGAEPKSDAPPEDMPDSGGAGLSGFSQGRDERNAAESATDYGLMSAQQNVTQASTRGDQAARDAKQTVETAGQDAQSTKSEAAAGAAAGAREDGWGKAVADGVQKGIETGLAAAGAAFGSHAAEAASGSIFGGKDKDPKPEGGGSPDAPASADAAAKSGASQGSGSSRSASSGDSRRGSSGRSGGSSKSGKSSSGKSSGSSGGSSRSESSKSASGAGGTGESGGPMVTCPGCKRTFRGIAGQGVQCPYCVTMSCPACGYTKNYDRGSEPSRCPMCPRPSPPSAPE